jgi:hypothetical protein
MCYGTAKGLSRQIGLLAIVKCSGYGGIQDDQNAPPEPTWLASSEQGNETLIRRTRQKAQLHGTSVYNAVHQ